MTDAPAPSIAALAPTIAALLGADPPALSTAQPLEAVIEAARRTCGDEPLDRCLVYAPDAIGAVLRRRELVDFAPVVARAPVAVRLRAEMPSKTPVCFASMFTGAPPEIHGIRQYEKPVLTCDTLFDALLSAGRRVAIVTVRDSSVDLIFRQRELDHFSEDYDGQVTARTLALIERDEHHFILAYHQEYDDELHRSTPFSAEALAAARRHVDAFAELADAARKHWRDDCHAVAFTPDHGAHVDEGTGRGTHGSSLPDDLDVWHYWGFGAAQSP